MKLFFSHGRPPKFNSAIELQKKISEYFELLTHDDRPTISGLCGFLGFASRQAFYDLQKRKGFSYTIQSARLAIETTYERLLHGSSANGAIFALKNFGWKDQSEVVNKNIEVEDLNALEKLEKQKEHLSQKAQELLDQQEEDA